MTLPRLSLRGRVVIAGTTVVLVLVIALNVFVYVSLRDQLLGSLERILDARAQLVTGLRDELDPEDLARHLDEIGVRAVILLPGGERLISGEAPDYGLLPPGRDDEPFARRAVELDDGAVAVLFASRGGIEATLDRLMLLTVAGTIVVTGLAFAVFARLAGRVLRPVRDVALTAREITAGDLDQRLRRPEADRELHDMVVSLNEMLDALQSAIARSQQAEAFSRTFLADAAHQLRTPAAGIRASVAALVRSEDDTERERMIDNLASESARLAKLLSSLLRVARLDRREEPAMAEASVDRLLAETVERYRVRAPAVDIRLAGEDDVRWYGDAAALQEAVGNLVENAVRHARKTVEVGFEATGDEIRITVADDGPGVPAGMEATIFDRFVSLDAQGGSGLGLPIAQGVARAHGGDLTYQDGVFVLALPRRSASASAES